MPQPGFFVLHPAVLPPLPADTYTLHGDITAMSVPDGSVAPLDSMIKVSSPRFTMPPDQILSTYPPANREGSFATTLPQIVLKRRTLPWERKVDADERVPWLALVVVAEGEGFLSPETPIEQCLTDFSTLPQPADRDVATSVYLSVSQTVVNAVFPTKEDLSLLAHVREVDIHDSELLGGDDDGFVAVVIANRLPQPAFDAQMNAVPRKYLACLVNLETQLPILPPPVPDNATISFDAISVVQDVRELVGPTINSPDHFAMGGGTSASFAVHAASVGAGEHDAAARAAAASLASNIGSIDARADTVSASFHAGSAWAQGPAAIDAAAVSIGATDAAKFVRDAMAGGWSTPIDYFLIEPTYRFPVLAHWSFTVTGDGTFEQYMQHLDVGLIGTLVGDVPPLTAEEQALAAKRAAPPAAARPAPELAETGHVGLDHRTRRGDLVRAWFRGPLSPHPTLREEPHAPDPEHPDELRLPLAHTSDQLRVVVPDGREDISLAAAFEIGRLLALSQPSIVNAMLRWRQEQFGAQRAAQLAAEAAKSIAFLPPELFGQPNAGLGALVGRHVVLNGADRADDVFAPGRRLVDPGRPLTFVDGDLDQAIADGFGFSLDAVRRRADQVGVAAALAATAVPVGKPPEPTLEGTSFDALRGALDARVDTLARQVLKQPDVRPSGARRARRQPVRAPLTEPLPPDAPDALDALLDRLGEGGGSR